MDLRIIIVLILKGRIEGKLLHIMGPSNCILFSHPGIINSDNIDR